jgi:hypothetical protein
MEKVASKATPFDRFAGFLRTRASLSFLNPYYRATSPVKSFGKSLVRGGVMGVAKKALGTLFTGMALKEGVDRFAARRASAVAKSMQWSPV